MNKNLTEMVFILDRSGSMAGLEKDTIGGFNAMIAKQKREDGKALVSTVLFDGTSRVIHDRVDLQKVRPLTEKEYSVGGCTALLDAIGSAVHHINSVHRYIRREDVPAHTIFVITTDGMENASHRYTAAAVRNMISQKKEKGWEFLFLGANIDALQTAGAYGIDEDHAVNYCCDSTGTALNFDVLASTIGSVRRGHAVTKNWKQKIDEDYAYRKNNKV